MRDIITSLITFMGRCVTFMRSIEFTYGEFHVSLWDVEIAFLVLSVVLMVALPHFNSDD